MRLFKRDKPTYTDGVLDLIEDTRVSAEEASDHVPSIFYTMYRHGSFLSVGRCDLRLGMTPELYYVGSIGYRVHPPYRGHHYARRACKLLFSIAKEELKMTELIITCNPDNIASRKTCEELGGQLKEIVPVPEDHWLRKQGDTEKCIFVYTL